MQPLVDYLACGNMEYCIFTFSHPYILGFWHCLLTRRVDRPGKPVNLPVSEPTDAVDHFYNRQFKLAVCLYDTILRTVTTSYPIIAYFLGSMRFRPGSLAASAMTAVGAHELKFMCSSPGCTPQWHASSRAIFISRGVEQEASMAMSPIIPTL